MLFFFATPILVVAVGVNPANAAATALVDDLRMLEDAFAAVKVKGMISSGEGLESFEYPHVGRIDQGIEYEESKSPECARLSHLSYNALAEETVAPSFDSVRQIYGEVLTGTCDMSCTGACAVHRPLGVGRCSPVDLVPYSMYARTCMRARVARVHVCSPS